MDRRYHRLLYLLTFTYAANKIEAAAQPAKVWASLQHYKWENKLYAAQEVHML